MNPNRESAARAAKSPLHQQAHRCGKCGHDFVVTFEVLEPDEALERAPVACPHCWQIDHVMVSASARWGRNYRAEKH